MSNQRHTYSRSEPTPEFLASQVQRVAPAVASHQTAWRLHGLVVPSEMDDRLVHVSRPVSRSSVVRRGFRCHRRAGAVERVTVGGVMVTSPRQTWLDLAAIAPNDDLRVACGDMLVGDNPQVLHELLEFTKSAKGVKGICDARRVVQWVRLGAESIQETRVRLALRAAGLPEPLLNQDVVDARGKFIGRCDMVYPDAKLIIEYEGQHHVTLADQYTKDIVRYQRLQGEGWRVVRLNAPLLNDPEQRWLDDVRAHLARA